VPSNKFETATAIAYYTEWLWCSNDTTNPSTKLGKKETMRWSGCSRWQILVCTMLLRKVQSPFRFRVTTATRTE
jgi:hypothetical protein